MSNFGQCPLCKEYALLNYHKCKPIFFFKHEDWGDEFQQIRAVSFDDAAREFAKKYNENGDYALMDSDPVEVIISDGKTEKKFSVSAEASIDYNVDEKK